MAVFLGDSAFYLATLVFAAGIFMIHHANHHDTGKPCRLLKSGGYIVVVVSLFGALCTGYFWLKYYSQGNFDQPYPQHHAMMGNIKSGMMDGKKMGMNPKMMGQMMNHCMQMPEGTMMDSAMREKMKSCVMNQVSDMSGDSQNSQNEHESHH